MQRYEAKDDSKEEYDKVVDRILTDIGAKSKYPELLKMVEEAFKNVPNGFHSDKLKKILNKGCRVNTLYLNAETATKLRSIIQSNSKGFDPDYHNIIRSRVLDYWNLKSYFDIPIRDPGRNKIGFGFTGNGGEIKIEFHQRGYKDPIKFKRGLETILEYKSLHESYKINLKKFLYKLKCDICGNKNIKLIFDDNNSRTNGSRTNSVNTNGSRTCINCHFEKIKLLYLYSKQFNQMDKNILKIIVNYTLI